MGIHPSWGTDDEYMKLIQRMNQPWIAIDNEASENATVIKYDGARHHKNLMEAIEVLVDLDLGIQKAYISSDGPFFMHVFHVTNQNGEKLRDAITINRIGDCIQKSLEAECCFVPTWLQLVGASLLTGHTSIELTATNRPGLLSEVFAVLTCLECNVVNAVVWTHNARTAAVIYVTDVSIGSAITDPERLSNIEELLFTVLMASKDQGAKVAVSREIIHTERRLHQMMFADRDYERSDEEFSDVNIRVRPSVTVINCCDKGYSMITVRCKDRPKLLFDIVCTLTDMDYVVFHGNVDAESPEAYLEFFIRHVDGSSVNSEAERQRVIQCLKAAIERRVSEGLKLELCAVDRVGLLADITRIFRENSLIITKAQISTRAGKAIAAFYVRDAAGNPVDAKLIHSIRQIIRLKILKLKSYPEHLHPTVSPQDSPVTGYCETGYCETLAPPRVRSPPFMRTISWNSVVNCVFSPPSL